MTTYYPVLSLAASKYSYGYVMQYKQCISEQSPWHSFLACSTKNFLWLSTFFRRDLSDLSGHSVNGRGLSISIRWRSMSPHCLTFFVYSIFGYFQSWKRRLPFSCPLYFLRLQSRRFRITGNNEMIQPAYIISDRLLPPVPQALHGKHAEIHILAPEDMCNWELESREVYGPSMDIRDYMARRLQTRSKRCKYRLSQKN